jgi:hypothetical protein
MKYREKWIEFANFHVDPSERLFANARRVGCLRRFHKGKRKRVFGIHARRDAGPSIPAAVKLDDEFRRLKVGHFMVCEVIQFDHS